MTKKTNGISVYNILYLLCIGICSFCIFIFPLKLGSPYIDELGFFIPSALEVIFAGWPALYIALFSLTILCVCAIYYVARNESTIRISLITILLFIFLLLNLLSVMWSVNKYASIVNCILIFSASVGFIMAKWIRYHSSNNTLYNLFFVIIITASVCTSIQGIHQFLYGLDEMRKMIGFEHFQKIAMLYKNDNPQNYALYLRLMSNRIFSTFVYPNSYAGYLCMIIPFIIELFRLPKKKMLRLYIRIITISMALALIWFYTQSQIFFIPIAFIGIVVFPITIIVCLFLTGSFGGILTVCLLLLIYVVQVIKNVISRKHLSIAGSIFIIFLALVFLFVPFKHKSKSLHARLLYWKSAINMIIDSPIKGYGIGTFGTVYPKYKLPNAEETQFAHNMYFQQFAETGLNGGMLFILLLFWGLFYFFHTSSKHNFFVRAGGYALLAFCFHGLVDFDFNIPALAFYGFTMLGFIDNSPIFINLHLFNKKVITKICFVVCIIIFFICSYISLIRLFTAQVYFNIAQQLIQQKDDFRTAQRMLLKAQQITPCNAKIFFARANLYLNNRQFTESLSCFEQAVTYNPFRASYHYAYGHALLDSGDPTLKEKAKLEFIRASEYNPSRKEYKTTFEHEGQ